MIPVAISTDGYCHEILDLHVRHLPLKNRNEKTGTRSLASNSLLHEKHFERPLAIFKFVLRRKITTFKKLPIIDPKRNAMMRAVVVIFEYYTIQKLTGSQSQYVQQDYFYTALKYVYGMGVCYQVLIPARTMLLRVILSDRF